MPDPQHYPLNLYSKVFSSDTLASLMLVHKIKTIGATRWQSLTSVISHKFDPQFLSSLEWDKDFTKIPLESIIL